MKVIHKSWSHPGKIWRTEENPRFSSYIALYRLLYTRSSIVISPDREWIAIFHGWSKSRDRIKRYVSNVTARVTDCKVQHLRPGTTHQNLNVIDLFFIQIIMIHINGNIIYKEKMFFPLFLIVQLFSILSFSPLYQVVDYSFCIQS